MEPCKMMERVITQAMFRQTLVFGGCGLFLILILIGFETDFLPQGEWVDNTKLSYMATYLGYLLILGMVPFALWFFAYSMKKYRAVEPDETAIRAYTNRSMLRMLGLTFSIGWNLIVYYLTLDSAVLKFMLIGGIAVFFCIPNRTKMLNELTLVNENED